MTDKQCKKASPENGEAFLKSVKPVERVRREPGLNGATNLVSPDATGANGDGFVLTAGQNHFAFLQVGVLEEAVVLVGEANFVGFVATLIANFADAGHEGNPLFCTLDSSGDYLNTKKAEWQHVPALASIRRPKARRYAAPALQEPVFSLFPAAVSSIVTECKFSPLAVRPWRIGSLSGFLI